ncbi:MAG: alpha-ketoglutarate-dependent dioxygenase AlkB family protein [Pseudohongiellaceae bacterium]
MYQPDSMFSSPACPDAGAIGLPDAQLDWYPNWCEAARGDLWQQRLMAETPWRQDHIRMYGRKLPVPRLQAWYGEPQARYRYSGILLAPLPFTPLLLEIRTELEQYSGHCFNAVLLNLYRDGKDSMSWHSDDERELGADPVIASVSLGSTRRFELRHRHRRELGKLALQLTHGSLLLMGKGVQPNWLHQIPKQPGVTAPRLNLTFRFIG